MVILQNSLLVHFEIFGAMPNFILISLIIFIFFENQKEKFSIMLALSGGFITDIFSNMPLGTTAIIFLILMLLLKKGTALVKELNFLCSFLLFSLSVIFYIISRKITLFSLAYMSQKTAPNKFDIGWLVFIEIILNIIIGLIIFYILKFGQKYVRLPIKKRA